MKMKKALFSDIPYMKCEKVIYVIGFANFIKVLAIRGYKY